MYGLHIVDQCGYLGTGLGFLLCLLWRWLIAAGHTGRCIGQGFIIAGAIRVRGTGAILRALAYLLWKVKGVKGLHSQESKYRASEQKETWKTPQSAYKADLSV